MIATIAAGVTSPDAVGEAASAALAGEGYLADRALALRVYLAVALEQPLLLEGEAGVGKTEVARALAAATGARLIRLQCHEGIDLHHAVYDWDYARQLLALRAAEGGRRRGRAVLARASCCAGRCSRRSSTTARSVLLIDEIDRADDEFEAFLLEFLSDFAVTIPELGTITRAAAPAGGPDLQPHARAARRAQAPLPVPLDRLPRRPSARREIVRARLPGVPEEVVVARVSTRSRGCASSELYKLPGRGGDDRVGAGAAARSGGDGDARRHARRRR